MVKFFPYFLCAVMAFAFGPALGQSSDVKKNDPQVKRQAKKQEDAKQEDAKREDKAERSAAAGGSVKKEDLDDDGKNKKEKD